MGEKDIIEYDTEQGKVTLSPAIVRRYLVNGNAAVTDQEVRMFMALCKYQGLNPYLRDAYLIKYSERSPATMVVGKDAFTKRAVSIKECKGWNAGVIVRSSPEGDKIVYRKGAAVFEGETLVGGWAEVFREGWAEPLRTEVTLTEYQKMRDGKPSGSWATIPATMIRKVPLVQALREAFPDRFQGMYDQAEMATISDTSLPENRIELVNEAAPKEEPPNPPEPTFDARKPRLEEIRSILASIHDVDGEHLFHKEEANLIWGDRNHWPTEALKGVIEQLQEIRNARASGTRPKPSDHEFTPIVPGDLMTEVF